MGFHKLNLGCGANHLQGYINIDARIPKNKKPDFQCDITELPYKKNTIEEISCYHVIEHLTKDQAIKGLKLWHRILKPGCPLIIECPNVMKVAKELGKGNEAMIDSLYGLQRNPFDHHKYGYTPNTLGKLLTEIGFSKVVNEEPQDYHTELEPCMRIVAYK